MTSQENYDEKCEKLTNKIQLIIEGIHKSIQSGESVFFTWKEKTWFIVKCIIIKWVFNFRWKKFNTKFEVNKESPKTYLFERFYEEGAGVWTIKPKQWLIGQSKSVPLAFTESEIFLSIMRDNDRYFSNKYKQKFEKFLQARWYKTLAWTALQTIKITEKMVKNQNKNMMKQYWNIVEEDKNSLKNQLNDISSR